MRSELYSLFLRIYYIFNFLLITFKINLMVKLIARIPRLSFLNNFFINRLVFYLLRLSVMLSSSF